jgi:hypothetical protein
LDKGDYRGFSECLREGPDSTTFDPLKSPLKKRGDVLTGGVAVAIFSQLQALGWVVV